ncbi:MAG: helix-hairpin-helix domain-containing protein [Clostridia bacterium]|nr:helix-hairpin-helix domain-containing protein [Clostridia bacterium]
MGKIEEISIMLQEKIRNNKKISAVIAVVVIIILSAGITTFNAYEKKKEDAELLRQQLLAAQLENEKKETGDASEDEFSAQAGEIIVDVCGCVKKPGIVKLSCGARVYEAIEAAGGKAAGADTSVLNLAQELSDGVKLIIPSFDETMNMPADAYGIQSYGNYGNYGITGGEGSYDAGSYSNGSKVNINSADSGQLQSLSGVGPSTAEKIINYRTSNGRFSKIEDLKNVSGIGDKTFEKLKDFITV